MQTVLIEFISTYPGIFVADLTRYLLAAVPLAILIFWIKPAKLMGRKLQARTATRKAISSEIRYSVSTAAIFALNGCGVVLGIQHDVLNLYDTPDQYGWLWFALSFPLILVVHDAYFYWTHRAMHHPKLFRYFHRAHHRSHTPTPWAAYAFDPAEAFVQAVFLPLYLLVLPTNGIVVGFFLVFMIVRNVMGHAGFELHPKWWMKSPLTRWNNTTAHHDLHHETAHWNYGLYFTWWDLMMGTEHPDYHQRFEAAWGNTPSQTGQPKSSKSKAGLTVAALFGAAVAAISFQQAKAADLHGYWATQGMGSVVRLQECDHNAEQLCGVIVWLWDDEEQDGTPKKDSANPNQSLTSRPLIGVALLKDFATGDDNPEGKIYNPEDGRTYRATIRAVGDDRLEVKGCVLMFCQTQNWRRANVLVEQLHSALPPTLVQAASQ